MERANGKFANTERLKDELGGNLRSREWDRQCVEGCVKCLFINKMVILGMPKGVWEEAA